MVAPAGAPWTLRMLTGARQLEPAGLPARRRHDELS